MNKICLIGSLMDWVQVYMNQIAQSIQSTHINGGNDERLCSVLLLQLI